MADAQDPRQRWRLLDGQEGVYCPYRGRVLASATRDCPRCPKPPESFAEGDCPGCGVALEPRVVGEARAVGECTQCGGLWFDQGAIHQALDLRVGIYGKPPTLLDVRRAMPPELPEPPNEARYGRCARCAQPMTRRAAAPLSNVVIQICPPHGLWFPRGQYERFGAFVQAGGLDLAPGEAEREATENAQLERSRERDARIRTLRQRRYRGSSGFPF